MGQATSPALPSPPTRHCWSTVGVRGDKSCEALIRHAHCRNCPTYSELAATLLLRESVREPGNDWTEHYGETQEVSLRNDRSALIFRIGSEWFGIATQSLDEVVECRAIHRIPHTRSPVVLGVVNVRGELVVCVSLDRLLGIAADRSDGGKMRRLLVLQTGAGRLAVPVDEVQHTHAYQSSEIFAPPATIAQSTSSYATGLLSWRDRIVACLDDTRLIEALEGSLG